MDTPGLHFPGYRQLVEGNGDRYEMSYLLRLEVTELVVGDLGKGKDQIWGSEGM